MKKSMYRTILIWLVLLIAAIHVYPTLGWMCLSDGERAERTKRWKLEDDNRGKPNFLRDAWASVRRWSEFDREQVINLGLDLQGGIHMVVGLDVDAVWDELKERYPEWDRDDIIKQSQLETLQRIERRINDFEAKEPVIQALGDDRIQIQLPGQKDLQRAKDLIMRAAWLEFHMVAGPDKTLEVLRTLDEHSNGDLGPRLKRAGLGEVQPFEVSMEDYEHVKGLIDQAQADGLIPEDTLVAFSGAPKAWETKQRYLMYILESPAGMSGEGLKLAMARPDEERGGNRWKILFQFSVESGRKFAELTETNVGRNMAIVVDDVVESAPTINQRISTNGEITGQFDQQEAQDLAIALNSGSMNVPITEEMTGVVGPGLGRESIRKGVISAAVGLLIVMLFMAYYYRLAGIVANIALMINALLVVAALAYFNATLTLPGIAGMILTIGMAVDANVLIFERIREEIRNGKSLLASIDSGFSRATVTILDANVTTLIAAAVLMEFGTGPIEGFAVTLSIGVCSSVFTALIVSRAIFDFLSARKWVKRLGMASWVRPDTAIKFLDKRRAAFIASATLIIAGLIFFAVRRDDNFGVDFRTGTNMVVNLKSEGHIDGATVRTALADAGFSEPQVVAYEGSGAETENQFLIRLNEVGTVGAEGAEAEPAGAGEEGDAAGLAEAVAPAQTGDFTVSGKVERTLAALCDEVVTEKVDTVGPAVGKQLKWDAFWAILYALVFIIAYLWFRFELKFAVAAVVALLHDVLVTVGLFALIGFFFGGRQISLPVIAALLTIIGYSLNDTIVVFDRVREDLRLYRGRGLSYPQIMDMSINQTLSRTLLTSLTTLFVVVVLYFFGGAVINDFAFALIAGVVVGTYSSIFVASPVVYLWQKLQGKHVLPHGGGQPGGGRRSRKRKAGGDKPAEAAAE
ncbi:MAG: protein translocase subunit SecD [Candidatus Hydrogenedentes bacterium]|nr:protein translocase subunit SecD [Candidatus Hydrogenedentota bacterium]